MESAGKGHGPRPWRNFAAQSRPYFTRWISIIKAASYVDLIKNGKG